MTTYIQTKSLEEVMNDPMTFQVQGSSKWSKNLEPVNVPCADKSHWSVQVSDLNKQHKVSSIGRSVCTYYSVEPWTSIPEWAVKKVWEESSISTAPFPF